MYHSMVLICTPKYSRSGSTGTLLVRSSLWWRLIIKVGILVTLIKVLRFMNFASMRVLLALVGSLIFTFEIGAFILKWVGP